ncbi:DUF3566 domain-containing protein [Corynebacterium sputi]|uniref:DUF3566 domain-containing protein n=1 Tax=Corynebacterium sputi TaxID=489915 RepID=UPI0003FEC66C|nr:DUF3566 domain-containing protein [Corynebacterium sputi]
MARETTLVVRRIDPLSTLKISASLGVIGFLVWMIAAGIIYFVLSMMGVWNSFGELVGAEMLTAGPILGGAAGVGVLWMILFPALLTLGAVIYNACAGLVGGISVVLGDNK